MWTESGSRRKEDDADEGGDRENGKIKVEGEEESEEAKVEM